MKGGKEGARFHAEGAVRDLLDAAGDAEAMELIGADGFEDEQVERALKQGSLGLVQRKAPVG
jgi:hypothetical protein